MASDTAALLHNMTSQEMIGKVSKFDNGTVQLLQWELLN